MDTATTITVKIKTRAKKDEIVGALDSGTIKINLTAPPLEGRANESLIKFLAKHYGVPPASIEILKGQKNITKVIKITP